MDQSRLFFLCRGRSSRGDESQEDLGKRRWGFGGESGATQVSGVLSKRRMKVIVPMVMETYESLFKNICTCLSITETRKSFVSMVLSTRKNLGLLHFWTSLHMSNFQPLEFSQKPSTFNLITQISPPLN